MLKLPLIFNEGQFGKIKNFSRSLVTIEQDLCLLARDGMQSPLYAKFLGKSLPLDQEKLTLADAWRGPRLFFSCRPSKWVLLHRMWITGDAYSSSLGMALARVIPTGFWEALNGRNMDIDLPFTHEALGRRHLRDGFFPVRTCSQSWWTYPQLFKSKVRSGLCGDWFLLTPSTGYLGKVQSSYYFCSSLIWKIASFLLQIWKS